jgi:arginine exporter protein ArgO
MATITDLSRSLELWIRHLRLQRAFTWSLRGLILGLVLALAVGAAGLYQAGIVQNEFLVLVVTLSLMTPLIAGLTAYLWRIHPLEAARRFDILFHLDERVSTAFELHQHPEHVPPELLDCQLEDAVLISRGVEPSRALPLRLQWREGLIALIFVMLIGLVWFRGETWFRAAQQAREVKEAVAGQSAQIEEIIKQIDVNNALTDEQKQALTKPLQEAQQSLKDNPSLENSVSVLTSTGEKLESFSDAQSQATARALRESGQELSQQNGGPLESVGEDLAQGDVISAASKLGNIDLSGLSSSEQQQLADQLAQMADTLQATNPQLANQLNQAARALQNGDTASAQQALSDAAQSLAQAGQQVAFSQSASQTASQLQQGAGQVIAAGGGGQQQANQSGPNGQGGNQSGQTSGSNGSGSGSGSDAGTNQAGSEAGSDPIAQNNGAGDGGESSYEQIYAPSLLGGEDGSQVNLPSSGENGGEVIGQGPTTPGTPSESLVPYSQVYSQYEQMNNQAIESGDIPAQFIQIIKNYFNVLKP